MIERIEANLEHGRKGSRDNTLGYLWFRCRNQETGGGVKNIKEINFIKQVERTAKRDAYLTAARYIKHFGAEEGLKIILDKAAGHTEYLRSLPLVYSYAKQTLEMNGIDGELLSDKLDGLMTTVLPSEKESE